MRKSHLPKKLLILFSFFLFGSLLISGCRSKRMGTTLPEQKPPQHASFVINLNAADASDLQKLPHVGPVLAQKIIEHRERYGPFRKPEHILIIDGVSEKRFREFRPFIDIK